MLGLGLAPGRGIKGGQGGGAPAVPIQSVDANGWSATASAPGAAVGQTLSVQRPGFTGTTAATITETLLVTQRVRQPYPSHASLTSTTVALSDYLYAGDTIEGVTNGSAETSPKPVANWASPDKEMVGAVLPRRMLEVVAFHRNARDREQVAGVEWTISDGVVVITVTRTVSEISGRPGDRFPVVVYRPQFDVDISALANPATLTVNARVFPHIGGAASVLNSADQSGRREFSPRSFRRDTAIAAAPVHVYVSTSGNDATGVVGTDAAAAAATPCATIGGALNRLVAVHGRVDGCRIRLMAGTHVLTSAGVAATRTQDHARVTIERDPAASLASVILQYGSVGFVPRLGAGWLTIRDVTFVRTGATQMVSGIAGVPLDCMFEDMPMDMGSISAAMPGNTADIAYAGIDFVNLSGAVLAAGAREIRGFRGCLIPASANLEGWLVLGCDISFPTGGLGYGSRSPSGSIAAFNRVCGPSPSNAFLNLVGDASGAVFAQNIVEYTSATAGPAARITSDNATGNVSHILLHHNTFAGFFTHGRANLFYEDGATPRSSKLMSMRGNIHVQINTKGDVFVSDGARLGNWAYLYGVGCQGEFSQFIDADNAGLGSTFAQAYPGPNASIGTSNTLRNDPMFVDYKGTTSGPTAGTGGGDYALQPGSPAKARAEAVIRFDAAGVERTALSSSGAYQ